MEGLRDVIERRVNLFGVQEPVVQVQKTGEEYRLIVELAGVIDPAEAIEMIGKTPYLEFQEEMTAEEKENILEELRKEIGPKANEIDLESQPFFKPTELTGKYLKGAKVEFDQTTYKPQVGLEFNSEGAKIFEDLTERNVGERLAIYIDNQLISAPVVQEKISGGKAQITGDFTIEEAKDLAQNLNAGALPVPIKLISQQNIGPSLGEISIEKSIRAGMIGFGLVILFMILIYRFSGFLAAVSLLIYGAVLLSLFKVIPVTLTLSGIAGFILSLGMAVDANILIFERFREEKKRENSFKIALDNGFSRAWPAIRDGNLTTLIMCAVLFLISSGFAQGFALTLGTGILVSMFTAMVITKLFMKTFGRTRLRKLTKIWTR
jgi:protein-export membrane protein SecD